MRSYRIFWVVLALALVVLAAFFIKPKVFYQGCDFYSGIIGSILGAFFAAFLVWVAWEELGSLGKTSSADFTHKLKNDFFRPETRILVTLLDCDALEYRPNATGNTRAFPYFEVIPSAIDNTGLPEDIRTTLTSKQYYSAWEVDDLLLGHFEDIGMFEQRGIIDFQMVYDEFSWYIGTAWNNDNIKEYIRGQRAEENTNRVEIAIYYFFQYIATKCIEYDTLHPGVCIRWWKLKRRVLRGPKLEIQI